MIKFLRKIETLLSYIERVGIVLVLSLIIILSFSGIVFRNLGMSVPPWVSDVLNYSVMWVGFIGASLASRYDKQVNINLLSAVVDKNPNIKRVLNILTNLFVVPVAFGLFLGAWEFIKVEYDWGIDVPSLGVGCWIFESILVYAYMAIAFKYIVRVLEAIAGKPFPEEIEEQKNAA